MNPALDALLAHHGGLITRAVALQVVPARVLEGACRRGDLLRVLPTVYVDPTRVPLAPHPLPEARGAARSPLLRASGEPRRVRSDLLTRLPVPTAWQAALDYADHPPVNRTSPVYADHPPVNRTSPVYADHPPATRTNLVYADHPPATRTSPGCVAGGAALGNRTALAVWGLRRQPPGEPLHLEVPPGRGLRTRPGLVVHRRGSLAGQVVTRRGVSVVRLERALVDSWPLLAALDRRDPLIRAVNDGLTTPDRVAAALAGAPRLIGRAELRTLLDRLRAGCRSPLEIWGHDRVFVGPGMPPLRRQFPVRLGARTVYLDAYAEAERVDFELDGATTHGDPRQREVDLRRDALLATRGILVVRFAHRRLVHEPDEVRREALAILATRRRGA
ncbi:DUF559 domain-containing protein [Micromonospora sp. NPDC000207]|uniref:DUF559 domain-containing protein n=1 Tax=Micromonospora sp. NPDC000207 TaxID=3154246 RepID=UPI00332B6BDA